MPCTFTEALTTKFGEDVSQGLGTVCEIFVVGSSRSTPDGKLMLPRSLTLNGCGIGAAGSQDLIKELCYDVEELDLAQNQLNELSEVDKIICTLPNLWFLNLSHNDLEEAEPVELNCSKSLRSLVLNHTHIPWETLTCLLDAMPNLQELHLSLNNYDSVKLDVDKQYSNIKRLHVSGNPLRDWEDIIHLGENFPNLEGLVMVDCKVASIPDPDEWNAKLSELRYLNMSNGPLSDWEDIDRLSKMLGVMDFRLLGVPFLENLPERERRQHLIARFPNATRLNGSDITRKEREDAERAFIRFYRNKEEKPKRFQELEKIHGELQPLVEIDLTPKTEAQVKVRYGEINKVMKLDLSKTVLDLKVKFAKVFGIAINKVKIFYIDHELMELMGPEEMRYNSKKLFSYQIQDGDEFLVDTKL